MFYLKFITPNQHLFQKTVLVEAVSQERYNPH